MKAKAKTRTKRRALNLLRRFPVTTLLVLQFVPAALIPAWVTHNPSARLITTLIAVALGSSLAAELFLQPIQKDQDEFDSAVREKASPRLPAQARRLTVAAIVVTVLAALTGLGSYGAGIGALENSPIASLITPFRPWMIIAATLHIVSWKAGLSTRTQTLKWLGLLVGVELAYTATTAILAPLVTTVFCMMVVCVLLGFIRPRWAVALIIVGVLAWPAAAGIRNAVRVQQGADVYSSAYNPSDRLRMDLLMEPLRGLGTGADLGQPGPVQILRYGLIPRVIDSGRPPITTGRQLNVLVYGTATSSYTFTMAGNIWLMDGPWGLAVYCAGVALLLGGLLARRPGPWGLAVVALGFQYLVWMGASYPESVIGFVQSLVSLGTAWVLVNLRSSRKSRASTGRLRPLPDRQWSR